MPQACTPRGSDAPCPFCAIIAGEADAVEVHRSGRLVAFLDAHPLFPGHVLLVPAVHVQTHDELPLELAAEWLDTSQRLQRAVEAATGAEGALLLVNNVVSQSVPHVHLHVVPRSRGDGLRFFLGPRRRYRPGEAEAVAEGVRAALAADPPSRPPAPDRPTSDRAGPAGGGGSQDSACEVDAATSLSGPLFGFDDLHELLGPEVVQRVQGLTRADDDPQAVRPHLPGQLHHEPHARRVEEGDSAHVSGQDPGPPGDVTQGLLSHRHVDLTDQDQDVGVIAGPGDGAEGPDRGLRGWLLGHRPAPGVLHSHHPAR